MALSLPYLAATGPADRAPSRPPIVKEEETRPNCVGFIGMHCGREEAVEGAEVSWKTRCLMRSREEGPACCWAQVMTCWGALSSARW